MKPVAPVRTSTFSSKRTTPSSQLSLGLVILNTWQLKHSASKCSLCVCIVNTHVNKAIRATGEHMSCQNFGSGLPSRSVCSSHAGGKYAMLTCKTICAYVLLLPCVPVGADGEMPEAILKLGDPLLVDQVQSPTPSTCIASLCAFSLTLHCNSPKRGNLRPHRQQAVMTSLYCHRKYHTLCNSTHWWFSQHCTAATAATCA